MKLGFIALNDLHGIEADARFAAEHDYQGYLIIEPHGALWSRPPLREKMLLLTQCYIGQFLI